MNTLEIFKNTEFGLLDTVLIDDRVFFLGKQVALILQYANPSEAVADHVDKEDCIVLKYKAYSKTIDGLWTGNDFSDKVLINESGLYSLIASLTAVILSVVSICMALSGNADLWMLWFIPIPLSIYLDKQETYEKISWEKQASRIEDEFIYELSFTGSKPSVWKLFKKDIRSVLSGS